ncbi:hypothetical protein O6H91_06G032300 [Diphasiastrum complanatum]|uniref:Uncharacterized protein n=1 Tax=Diphasiastrum complanatum TaxID=34168 RepID=A0ACC2DC78_DIPCM|nr:hypothetical protein O6H91_06G032300 [Diphasiastrum complanatum]
MRRNLYGITPSLRHLAGSGVKLQTLTLQPPDSFSLPPTRMRLLLQFNITGDLRPKGPGRGYRFSLNLVFVDFRSNRCKKYSSCPTVSESSVLRLVFRKTMYKVSWQMALVPIVSKPGDNAL